MPVRRTRLVLLAAQLLALTLAASAAVATRAPAWTTPEDQMLATPPLAGPGDWLNDQRAGDAASVSPRAFERAAAQQEAILAATQATAPQYANAEWTLAGPTNIGGRIIDVVVDPVLANTIYVGAATGGIWKSTDAGATFTPAWPEDNTQAIGALAGGSDGTLWAGTGESNPGGGSITFGGMGVYKSTDRGATWTRVGLEDSHRIGRIVVDPKDPKRVLVAASGNLFLPGGQRGLYETRDAGATWKLLKAGANATTGAIDVALDPKNTNNVLVAMWDHQRTPSLRRYGGVGSQVLRSTNGGQTWTATTGLPTGADVGRIGIALAPSQPNLGYAIVVDASGDPSVTPMYLTVDGGATWTAAPPSPLLQTSQSTFGWWFGRLYVDPANPLHAYAAGVSLMETTTGGLAWVTNAGMHADQHAVVWDPKVPNRVYLGNDGGVYRSDTNGASASWTFATYQPWSQLYSVDVAETDPDRLVAGLQDNGCNRNSTSSAGAPGAASWRSIGCGDGLQTLINPTNRLNVFYCSQYGSCSRSTNGGDSGASIGTTTSTRRNWFTPVEFDPNNPNIVYYAGDRVNRSTTNGNGGWTAISPDLSGGDGPDPNYRFGTVTTIGIGKTDGNVLYVGTDDGRLWTTKDGGANWTRLLDDDIPGDWVTRVAVDPRDANVAYATFSGFRTGEDEAHVLRTTDGGQTWENVSGNLPAAPVNDIVFAGGDRLAVATDVGVFLAPGMTPQRDARSAEWLAVGDLPLVPITDLRWHEGTSTLTAATFGRSAMRTVLPTTAP